MTNRVVQLVPAEDTTKSAADFLRDLADAMDRGDEAATGVIVVIYERDGSQFRTATRKHNLDFLQEVGLLQTALFDVQNVSQD